ncbi:MAG TPA: pirin family protein [Paucimonas sp.]|nr:pirin family protein [Paucimonas sp.]
MNAATFSLLKPHVKDLGGFTVKRTLPGYPRKMVGPFIFFDHMGPASFAAGQGIDVRPHPHIGLATVTFLFEGALLHRDSLGSEQVILPGDVNWMTAGRGIAHSERTPAEMRVQEHGLHGIQIWVALPREYEAAEPSFQHVPIDDLPVFHEGDAMVRVIAGSLSGRGAPVRTFSPMFYAALRFQRDGRFELPPEYEERAVYAVDEELIIDGAPLPAHHMAVLESGRTAIIEGKYRSRAMLLGGKPVDGDRFIWWNFVASDKEAIAAAKARWREQGFGKVPGETEWIPLPDEPAAVPPRPEPMS